MHFYRSNFPTSTVIPKMHISEAHVVPFLRSWHVGVGFLDEQGVESIHHYFKRLALSYNAVRDPAQKLLLMLKEHMLHLTPENISARPNVKKIRKSK